MTNVKIFKSAWGYDQTNIDFYVVVKETAKTVTLVEIGKEYNQVNYTTTEVKPDMVEAKKVIEAYNKDKKSVDAFRKTLKTCFATPTVKIDSIRYASEFTQDNATETIR